MGGAYKFLPLIGTRLGRSRECLSSRISFHYDERENILGPLLPIQNLPFLPGLTDTLDCADRKSISTLHLVNEGVTSHDIIERRLQ